MTADDHQPMTPPGPPGPPGTPGPSGTPARAGASEGDGLLDGERGAERSVRLDDEGTQRGEVEPAAARRLVLAAGAMMLCIASTYLLPALSFAQPWAPGEDYVPFWNLVGREWLGEGARERPADDAQRELEAMARAAREPDPTPRARPTPPQPTPTPDAAPLVFPALEGEDAARPDPRVELEGADALKPYFTALALTELGYRRTPVRATHWGDSVLGNDGITGAIRARLQARFGDGGHGFHLLAQNNPSYRHKGVKVTYAGEWQRCYVINKCKKDRRYGLGGLTVWSSGGGETRFRFGRDDDEGHEGRTDRLEVWYATQPGGGDLTVKVDGEVREVIETRAEEPGEGRAVVQVPAGTHEYRVRATGGGSARAFGVVLEHEGPGLVWDGVALIGAFTSRFSPRYLDEAHFGRQLRMRGTELAVLMFGGNDLLGFRPARYRETFRSTLTMLREASPTTPCLVMSVIDHAERKGSRTVSKPDVAPMVQLQREEALAAGCAFFDAHAAMGGEGSMARWNRAKPRLASGDLAHLTHHGHQVMGELFTSSLLAAYVDFRQAVAGTPLPATAQTPTPAPGPVAPDPVAPGPVDSGPVEGGEDTPAADPSLPSSSPHPEGEATQDQVAPTVEDATPAAG